MSKITDHYHMLAMGRVSRSKQDTGSNEGQVYFTERWYLEQVPDGKVMKAIKRVHSGRDKDPQVLQDLWSKLAKYNRTSATPLTLILVDHWNRYFRNQEGGWYWVRRFQKIGIEINCRVRWIDWEDPYSKRRFGDEMAQAEQASDDISYKSKTQFQYHVSQGTYPVARVPRIFTRRWISRNPIKEYVIEKSEVFDPFVRSCDLILGGIGIKAAWRHVGGRAVLGSYDSYCELLRNEILIPRYRGVDVDVPAALGEKKFFALQRELDRRKPVARTAKTQHDFYLKPTLCCPHCGKPLTSDRAKSGKHHYYTCFHSSPRHYRIPAAEVHAEFDELLKQMTFMANSAQLAGKRAVERSKTERAKAEKEVIRLRQEQQKLVATEQNAVFLLAEGTLSERQFKMVEQKKQSVLAELRAAEALLENHGKILEGVLQSLQHIGTVFKENINRAMISHFARMAFVDGLVYDRKKRIFRTTSLNAALSLLPELSGSCPKLKTRLPVEKTNNRVMSGLPGGIRTAATDLELYRAYVRTAKLAI